MTRYLGNSRTLACVAGMFLAATLTEVCCNAHDASTIVLPLTTIASGPTLPPGPWDEGKVNVASGPTLPPGPWDEGKLA